MTMAYAEQSTMSSEDLAEQLLSTPPQQLVAMMYDQVLDSMRQTIEAIEANDIERRWMASTEASELLTQLFLSLDMQRGGEIAENLSQLYRFALWRLSRVDTHNDADAVRDAIKVLEPLRDSWHELDERIDAALTDGLPTVMPPANDRAGETTRASA